MCSWPRAALKWGSSHRREERPGVLSEPPGKILALGGAEFLKGGFVDSFRVVGGFHYERQTGGDQGHTCDA